MNFIINPAAGMLKDQLTLQRVIKYIKHYFGDTCRFELTKGVFHAAELAYKAIKNGFDTVISVGGDGTLNETIHGIIGNNINLGIVPMGAGNDFARSINLPQNPFLVLKNLKYYKKKLIDIVKIDNGYFANILGTGIDSEVVKILKGSKKYLLGFYKALRKHKTKSIRIIIDNEEYYLKDINLLVIANGKYFGHRMMIAPHSTVDDGFLDIIIVKGLSRFNLFLLFPKIYSGKHIFHKNVKFFKAKNIKINSDKIISFQKDGELFESKELNISIKPKCLNVLIP